MPRRIKSLAELESVYDKLLIIPTYHKGKLLPRFANTFDVVQPTKMKMPCIVFMQDANDIQDYDWLSEDWIIWTPEEPELTDIARVRWYIQDQTTFYGAKVLYVIDDDLKFAYRDLDKPRKYNKVTDLSVVIDGVEEEYGLLTEDEKLRTAVVGIPSRFGSGDLTTNQWNKRCICFYRLDLKLLASHDVYFDWQQTLMSDFEFNCQVAYAGLLVYIVAKFTRDGRENPKDPGGCNSYRNGKKELMEQLAARLRDKYPQAVHLEFDGKNGYVEGGIRVPRISWKALLNISNTVWSKNHAQPTA